MPFIDYPITDDDNDSRLDRFVRRLHPGAAQGRIEKLLRSGAIRLDGNKAKSSTRLVTGQVLRLPEVISTEGDKIKASTHANPALVKRLREALIREGDGWLALNKPSGIASQGGSGTRQHVDGALGEAFPHYEKLRLTHRLDRDTSGVLMIATHLQAARRLTAGFAAHDYEKRYLAIVMGRLPSNRGKINIALTKAGIYEKIMVDNNGQEAITFYEMLESKNGVSLVSLKPLTGRTHQLRVHMEHLGCPILGDGKYGGRAAFAHQNVNRLALHAASLRLDDGEVIIAEIPDDLAQLFSLFNLRIPQVKEGVIC